MLPLPRLIKEIISSPGLSCTYDNAAVKVGRRLAFGAPACGLDSSNEFFRGFVWPDGSGLVGLVWSGLACPNKHPWGNYDEQNSISCLICQ